MTMDCTDLVDLVVNWDKFQVERIFYDDYFSRTGQKLTIQDGVSVDVLTDIVSGVNLRQHYISLVFPAPSSIELFFEGSEIFRTSQGIFIFLRGERKLLWLPMNPMVRKYGENDFLDGQKELAFEEKADSVIVPGEADCRVEFSLMCVEGDIDGFFEAVNQPVPLESRPVMKARWFRYGGVCDTYKYLINGCIFAVSVTTGKMWKTQLPAFVLYHYLDFLATRTGKKFYDFLADIVAYSVMLSLPEDGRWRHGLYSDLKETHCRLEADGIQLLVSYYNKTGRKVFLQKAQLATDYLVSLSDELDDGSLWFLHDSIEANPDQSCEFYKNVGDSGFFGKSSSNTLCLNTHIWTLSLLHRLNEIEHREDYAGKLESGLKSLRTMLELRTGGIVYWAIYGLRDFLMKLRVRTESGICLKIQRKYDEILRSDLLLWLKKKSPRFCMPDGYIERDLCVTALSDGYHFVTFEDILVLYAQVREPWMREIIKKSMRYTARGDLAKCHVSRDPRVSIILEIISMYTVLVDDSYKSLLDEYLDYFRDLGFGLPADLLCHPLIKGFPEEYKLNCMLADSEKG